MARFLWWLMILAFIGLLLTGASWAAAYFRVGTFLGAPPPVMGTQTTSLLWRGIPNVAGHPRGWSFAYSPTQIPGAPKVRIYVSPTGSLIGTEPGNLPELLRDFRRAGY